MTMVWDKVTITMIGVTCIGILYAIAVSVIAYYKLPLFRIKRYRIIRKHQTFRCYDTEVLGILITLWVRLFMDVYNLKYKHT